MNAVVRFWLSVLSLVVSVSAVGYLFLSFVFPGTILVFEQTSVRVVVVLVGLLATGVLVWSTALFDEDRTSGKRAN